MSQTRVELRNEWNRKNYKSYTINLRYDNDQQLMDYIDEERAKGRGITDIVRDALELKIREDRRNV